MIRKDFKSDIEYFMYFYLKELQDNGFVKDFSYESDTFPLCNPYSRTYLYSGKRKTVKKEEHLLRSSSITADFSIKWNIEKSRNIFYLDPFVPIKCLVKQIPFRLVNESNGPDSLIEVKGGGSGQRVTSNISFPYKQKQCVKDHDYYIQKIVPYNSRGKGCLFENTFTPKEVLRMEIYKRDCKWGLKNTSKIKYKTRTLSKYLKMRKL